jgi:hypothetical protein
LRFDICTLQFSLLSLVRLGFDSKSSKHSLGQILSLARSFRINRLNGNENQPKLETAGVRGPAPARALDNELSC